MDHSKVYHLLPFASLDRAMPPQVLRRSKTCAEKKLEKIQARDNHYLKRLLLLKLIKPFVLFRNQPAKLVIHVNHITGRGLISLLGFLGSLDG
jgi:hypothetical protein